MFTLHVLGQIDAPCNTTLTDTTRVCCRYGELYSQARLDTLDALDELKELASAEELKNKLLFSVVVVSAMWSAEYCWIVQCGEANCSVVQCSGMYYSIAVQYSTA